MFNKKSYRPNVAIIIVNKHGQVLWCKRKSDNGWQFPQGGIDKKETPREAVLRETKEEVGLDREDLKIIYESKKWYRYKVPEERRPSYFISKNSFLGQEQKWFLAELLTKDSNIDLKSSKTIEFKKWNWVSYWYPLDSVIWFKKSVYQQALLELLPSYLSFMAEKEVKY